eukprot:gene12258-8768_t
MLDSSSDEDDDGDDVDAATGGGGGAGGGFGAFFASVGGAASQMSRQTQTLRRQQRQKLKRLRRLRRRQLLFASRASQLVRAHSLHALTVNSDVVFLADEDANGDDDDANGGGGGDVKRSAAAGDAAAAAAAAALETDDAAVAADAAAGARQLRGAAGGATGAADDDDADDAALRLPVTVAELVTHTGVTPLRVPDPFALYRRATGDDTAAAATATDGDEATVALGAVSFARRFTVAVLSRTGAPLGTCSVPGERLGAEPWLALRPFLDKFFKATATAASATRGATPTTTLTAAEWHAHVRTHRHTSFHTHVALALAEAEHRRDTLQLHRDTFATHGDTGGGGGSGGGSEWRPFGCDAGDLVVLRLLRLPPPRGLTLAPFVKRFTTLLTAAGDATQRAQRLLQRLPATAAVAVVPRPAVLRWHWPAVLHHLVARRLRIDLRLWERTQVVGKALAARNLQQQQRTVSGSGGEDARRAAQRGAQVVTLAVTISSAPESVRSPGTEYKPRRESGAQASQYSRGRYSRLHTGVVSRDTVSRFHVRQSHVSLMLRIFSANVRITGLSFRTLVFLAPRGVTDTPPPRYDTAATPANATANAAAVAAAVAAKAAASAASVAPATSVSAATGDGDEPLLYDDDDGDADGGGGNRPRANTNLSALTAHTAAVNSNGSAASRATPAAAAASDSAAPLSGSSGVGSAAVAIEDSDPALVDWAALFEDADVDLATKYDEATLRWTSLVDNADGFFYLLSRYHRDVHRHRHPAAATTPPPPATGDGEGEGDGEGDGGDANGATAAAASAAAVDDASRWSSDLFALDDLTVVYHCRVNPASLTASSSLTPAQRLRLLTEQRVFEVRVPGWLLRRHYLSRAVFDFADLSTKYRRTALGKVLVSLLALRFVPTASLLSLQVLLPREVVGIWQTADARYAQKRLHDERLRQAQRRASQMSRGSSAGRRRRRRSSGGGHSSGYGGRSRASSVAVPHVAKRLSVGAPTIAASDASQARIDDLAVLQSAAQIHVAASSLSQSDVYSWMCRPVVATYHFMENEGLAVLLRFLQSTPDLDAMKNNAGFQSLRMAAQCGMRLPSTSEFDTETRTPSAFAMRFASQRSFSDCCLYMTREDGSFVGLIGGDAKGEADAPCTAMAQAIQVSCDFLFHAVHVLGVAVNQTAIPFVVLCGGLVQFGAVYSLAQEFYPVPILLADPLPLYPSAALYVMLEGLVQYVRTHMMLWRPQNRGVRLPPRHLLRLQTEGYFFKPLQLFGQHPSHAGHQLRLLFSWFDALHACEALRHVVVFPVGVIGYPAAGDSDATAFLGTRFRRTLDTVIGEQLLRRVELLSGWEPCEVSDKRTTTSSSPRKQRAAASAAPDASAVGALPPGYPIVVYPRLEGSWQIAGVTYLDTCTLSQTSTVSVPSEYRSAFWDEVCRVVSLMAEAGVCHLDMRLSNLFYRVERGEVRVKVIDFDFAWRMGHRLPGVFRQWIDDTYNAFPKDIDVAGKSGAEPPPTQEDHSTEAWRAFATAARPMRSRPPSTTSNSSGDSGSGSDNNRDDFGDNDGVGVANTVHHRLATNYAP